MASKVLFVLITVFSLAVAQQDSLGAAAGYYGCYDQSTLSAVASFSTSEGFSLGQCLTYCFNYGTDYAALYGTTCSCTDTVPQASVLENDCNLRTTDGYQSGGNIQFMAGPGWSNLPGSSYSLWLSGFNQFTGAEIECVTGLVTEANATSSTSGSNSPANCIDTCSLQNYLFAAVSTGTKCTCFNKKMSITGQATAARCRSACPGDSFSTCGGSSAYDVYSTSYLGCVQDVNNNLNVWRYAAPLTIENCQVSCYDEGYPLAGLSGGNCMCGSSMAGAIRYGAGNCPLPCPGDSAQSCGGNGFYSVYSAYDKYYLVPGNALPAGFAEF